MSPPRPATQDDASRRDQIAKLLDPLGLVVITRERVSEQLRGGFRGGDAFPIADYDELTAAQVTGRLGDLTPAQLRRVRDHERRHANRKSVLQALERRLAQ